MAQHVEPMDIDSSVCDFDDKENAFHHNNAQPRTPCTEKGYEELDVSELNMKLRYSVTPAASPMSKSYAGNCFDNRNYETNNTLDNENGNMTRSLHTTLTKNDTIAKTQKTLPLQSLPTDLAQISDGNRNVLQPLDSTVSVDNNITVTLNGPNDIDENLSLPSSSSSITHTPEATTPIKEIPIGDARSPIIRGLQSVLNMFRPSQSPIPGEEDITKLETLSPPIVHSPQTLDVKNEIVSSSTPLVGHKTKVPLTKKASPNRESIAFNDDLENELEWKDDSTIIFSNEKIPIHKLFFQLHKTTDTERTLDLSKAEYDEHKVDNLNASVEYMDISYNDSGIMDKTATATKILSELNKSEVAYTESDSEFVDCESTFTKNESFKSQKDSTLNSTEDVLSHINDLVETKNVNASSETLISSDSKSANLSIVSIETANQNASLLTITNTTQEEKKIEEIQAENAATTAIPAVSDKIEIDSSNLLNELLSDQVTSNSHIQIKETIVSNSPVLENMGVMSLSQIPLIVDPRILLFNLPPVVNDIKNERATDEDPKTSPTDIPLPDDDDIPSLPGMNSELENLSHTLDKIAEEIPKINQHESSVSSVGSLSDNKSNESPVPENVFPSQFEENIKKIASGENTQCIYAEIKMEFDVKNIESSKSKENIHAVKSSSKNEAGLEITASAAVMSDKKNMPVTPTETAAKDIKIPSISKDNIPFQAISEIKSVNENTILSTTVFDNTDIPLSELPCSEMDEKVEITDGSLSVSNSTLVVTEIQPELNYVIPEAKSIIQKEIESQEKKPMDGTITDMQVKDDFDEIHKQHNIKVSDVTPSEIEPGSLDDKNEDSLNIKENKVEINNIIETAIQSLQKNQIPNSEVISNISETTQVTPVKSKPQILENNIDFIKQEVDAIVAKAIDIAIEKTKINIHILEGDKSENYSEKNNTKSDVDILKGKINDKSENYNFSSPLSDTTVNIEQYTLATLEQTEPEIYFLNQIDPTRALNETDVISFAVEADVQQKSLNQLSANKYDYTVQENIPVMLINHNAGSQQELNNETSFATETLIISADATTGNCIEETENKIQSYPGEIEDNILDVLSPDMVKIEPVATIDEEVIASENNSPFVSVTHELEGNVEVKPIENFDEIENSFATKSKVIKSPPASPKIVSKGYNFNFDEIEDPFATKTKIRMSPALDAPENQTFEQNINVEEQPIKKGVNRNYRRMSQPNRKRPALNNKKMNATFSGKSVFDTKPVASSFEAVSTPSYKIVRAAHEVESTKDFHKNVNESCIFQDVIKNVITEIGPEIKENKLSIKSDHPSLGFNEIKGTSSSEQSIYLSAGTSEEAFQSNSAIKLPDLDDQTVNNFASKSKIEQSPPPENLINTFVTKTRICQTPPLDTENPFATNSKLRISPETSLIISKDDEKPAIPINCITEFPTNTKKDIEVPADNITMNNETEKEVTSFANNNMELDISEDKESTENISGNVVISNNDKESTVREVNTEDEDTVEGPFLETDDLQNYDKMSDFDAENVDMLELPPGNEEMLDHGELFIDAEAFDFLLNQNKGNIVSDSGKESLFLKFDPLFANQMSSDGIMAALKHGQTPVKQSTPIKDKRPAIPRDATFDKFSPLAGPSGMNTTQEIDLNTTAEESYEDLNVTVSKPMMVVNPAVNPVVTPRNKTMTPVRSNRQSLTFTSPAIAVIDRLLSMSAANNSLMAHDTTVAEVPRDNEADLALTQLRELLADKEISVYNLRSETKELQNRLLTLESQMKNLETISEDRLKKINELNEKLNEKTQINKNMARVVEEYERTIASLIAETEQDKKRHADERFQLIRERDEQTAHLASMEVSFSDLHSKYEKSKQVIIGFKTNEDAYKKSIKEFEDNLAKMQKNYELLKQHATSKLNHANEELQKINRSHEAEVLKMNAMIKRKELHITSLEETLQQRSKANDELTAICDELINKVG